MKLPWQKVWFNWFIAVALSVMAISAGIAWGKSADCRPNQIDGQCGLSTFAGSCLGLAAALFVLLMALCRTLYLLFRRRRERAEST